ncbi:MAG: hypothetical protein ACHQQ3_14895, partial [Gemmatimonadales bacterium]
MKHALVALALLAVACRPRQPTPEEQTRAAAASDSLTLAFGESAADGARKPPSDPATTSAARLDPCLDRVRGDDFALVKMTLVDVHVPPGFAPVGADKSERDAQKTGYARYTWRNADNSVITIYPAAVSGKHDLMAMGIAGECDLSMAGAQVHIDVGVIGSSEVVRGVFTLPGVMALVFE